MSTLTLKVSPFHLAALRLLAQMDGLKTPEEELLKMSRDWIKSTIPQLSEEDLTELLEG